MLNVYLAHNSLLDFSYVRTQLIYSVNSYDYS